MTNIRLKSIDQYVDISSHTNYHKYHLKDSIEKRMERIYHSSRDSSRTPMQWDDSENAGFSEETPWFYVNPNYSSVNVETEEKDPESILWFYRKCLSLRKRSKTLIYGSYREYFRENPDVYMYERRLGDCVYLIICSFSDRICRVRLPRKFMGRKAKRVLGNYTKDRRGLVDNAYFYPYEARVYRVH